MTSDQSFLQMAVHMAEYKAMKEGAKALALAVKSASDPVTAKTTQDELARRQVHSYAMKEVVSKVQGSPCIPVDECDRTHLKYSLPESASFFIPTQN